MKPFLANRFGFKEERVQCHLQAAISLEIEVPECIINLVPATKLLIISTDLLPLRRGQAEVRELNFEVIVEVQVLDYPLDSNQSFFPLARRRGGVSRTVSLHGDALVARFSRKERRCKSVVLMPDISVWQVDIAAHRVSELAKKDVQTEVRGPGMTVDGSVNCQQNEGVGTSCNHAARELN
jgi:hypothetical protein